MSSKIIIQTAFLSIGIVTKQPTRQLSGRQECNGCRHRPNYIYFFWVTLVRVCNGYKVSAVVAKFLHSDNKRYDRTALMRSLIRVFIARTCQKVCCFRLCLIFQRNLKYYSILEHNMYLLCVFICRSMQRSKWEL